MCNLFTKKELLPEVKCTSVATEGYEIDNLISNDVYLNNKGFLAERFISGPVSVNIKLICPVDIKRIVIWTKVSNQKSLGFELSAQQPRINGDEEQFKRFASVVIPNHIDCIVFESEGQLTSSTNDGNSLQRCTFYRGRNHKEVEKLTLKIFKFQYVAAVKKIEIWGRPHQSCDRQMKRRVYSIWNRSQQNYCNADVPIYCGVDDNDVKESHSDDTSRPIPISNDSIPEEFYDEITREVMVLPMVLPSGKTVNYQTLEKFQSEENKWGRPPSDPFTGVPFTAQKKPIVASSLKLKIDSFFSRNSNLNDIKTLPRRLGSRNEYDKTRIKISKLLEKTQAGKRKLHSSSFYQEMENVEIITNGIVPSKRKSHTLCGSSVMDGMYTTTTSNKGQIYPSFLSPLKPKEEPLMICARCTTSTISYLYKLPCSHIICKLCLITGEAVTCNKCAKLFSSVDVEKVHISSHVH